MRPGAHLRLFQGAVGGKANRPGHGGSLAEAAAVEETADAGEGEAHGDPGRRQVGRLPHAELVLAGVVEPEGRGEEEAPVVGEPAPPDLHRGQAVAWRVAGVGGGIAHVVPAALGAGPAEAHLGLGRHDLEMVGAQVHVVPEVPVGDHVQNACARHAPDHQPQGQIQHPFPVHAQPGRLAPHHPHAEAKAERQHGEVGRKIERPQQRDHDVEVEQNGPH